MLMLRSPQEAYRRIDFDARVETSDSAQLVGLCFEQVVAALGTAIFAHDRRDTALRGQSLTRALSAVMALRLGISGDGQQNGSGITGALHQLYEGAGRTVLDSVMDFDALGLSRLRDDLREVAGALAAAPVERHEAA